VATPETGVDSISLTYALTDPLMTVFRPVAGVATAIVAGLVTNLFGAPRSGTLEPQPTPDTTACADSDPCHVSDHPQGRQDAVARHHHHEHVCEADLPPHSGTTHAGAVVNAARRIIRYGFIELLDDVSWWLALGIVLSAVAVVAIPAQLFEGSWGAGMI